MPHRIAALLFCLLPLPAAIAASNFRTASTLQIPYAGAMLSFGIADFAGDGSKTLLTADVDFALSENPQIRFRFRPDAAGGELQARVIDSKDLIFTQSLAIKPAALASTR